MKLFFFTILIGVILSSMDTDEKWIILLDKDLTQWETYLSYRFKPDYNGTVPKDESGNNIAPIGYNKDEAHVFSIIKVEGETVLRISGEVNGVSYTKQEYENYHLSLKVKWGDLKFDPRKNKLKDSGILYHSIGEAGLDYWRSWMLSQEFQIMEGHMGDYWNQVNAAVDIRSFPAEGKMNCVANAKQPFLPFGKGNPEGFCLRAENYESPASEWTTLELISWQGKSLHFVNGHVVMVLQNSRYLQDGKSMPLTKGKIQIQSEAAEVFFKDIRIRNLTALPKMYEELF